MKPMISTRGSATILFLKIDCKSITNRFAGFIIIYEYTDMLIYIYVCIHTLMVTICALEYYRYMRFFIHTLMVTMRATL